MLLHTQLQKHHAQSCFHQVHSVQQGMKKIITDMQNSITPCGWYHYCTAPQGYMSSDNDYTRRFDDIAETFLRVSKWWTMHFSCCLMTWSLWQTWFYPNFKNFVFGADTCILLHHAFTQNTILLGWPDAIIVWRLQKIIGEVENGVSIFNKPK